MYTQRKEVTAEQLKRMISRVFSTDEGAVALAIIRKLSGFGQSTLTRSGTTGEILEKSMIYNEGRRDTYGELRTFINDETLKKVEIDLDIIIKPNINQQKEKTWKNHKLKDNNK